MSEKSGNPASLGCGTLILVALIVLIFGNKNDDLVEEIRSLRNEVHQLGEEVRGLRGDREKGEGLPNAERLDAGD